jgi:membrane protease subunit HflC
VQFRQQRPDLDRTKDVGVSDLVKLSIPRRAVVAFLLGSLIIGLSSAFIVHQTQQVLVIRLGQPVRVVTEPGLAFKLPLIDNIVEIDNRIIALERPEQEFILFDQRRLVVDAIARYKIVQPLKFYQTVGSINEANSRLLTLFDSSIRRVLGTTTSIDVIRNDRSAGMEQVLEQLDIGAQQFGIRIVDVRFGRVVFPEQNSQAVYMRMQSERQREAAEIRAIGNQHGQEIRARADRDVTIIVADAVATGERVRGDGDAERNHIFAKAFGRDEEFAAFYRSMKAYETSLHGESTRLILGFTSQFFDYFQSPGGRRRTEVRE